MNHDNAILESRRCALLATLEADARAGLPAKPLVPHVLAAQDLAQLAKIERSWAQVRKMFGRR